MMKDKVRVFYRAFVPLLIWGPLHSAEGGEQ